VLVDRASRDVEFSAFYLASRPRLLRALVAVTGDLDEAEEALQEAYVKAAQRWRSIDAPEAWVRHAAMNLVRDSQRRTARRRRTQDRMPRPESVPEMDGSVVEAVRLLRQLPAEQREALALYYLLDMTVEQVAAELGRPSGTVKAQLARGRARLSRLPDPQEAACE
jgi:RNA polymerase sigma factor (sigma-70 family)